MERPQVMIVEDEFLIRLTLSEALADDGFDVIEAANGPEALRALPSHAGLALLLTDVQLPGGLNGVEVARRVREGRPDLPVIFMTGRPEGAGAPAPSPNDLFIAKPYLPSEVCAAARRLTGR